MSESPSATTRDAAGRFLPGQSGNPAGKAPGTRNRATLLRELMDEGEDRVIGRIVIDKAKSGDAVAARFVVAHLWPRPRARTVAIELADGMPAHNVVAAHDAVLRALFAGEIAPDEAEAVTRVLDARTRAIKVWGQEEYLMKCIPGFPAMVRPPAASRSASAPPAGAEASATAASTAGTPPADARQAEPVAAPPVADPPLAAPDREAGPADHQATPPDYLHSACIGTAPAAKISLPDTPALLALDRALLAAIAGLAPRRAAAPPAAGEDSA
jgi:hypothetical protein